MKQTEPDLTYFGPYVDAFRIHVHQFLLWGYEDALPEIKSGNKDREETAITGFIVKAMKNRRRALKPPSWLKYYSVQDDPPIEAPATTGRSRPRADIIVEAMKWPGCPEYVFEAKRLRRGSHGVANYVNSDGMGCFIQGNYADRYDEAAMLGYVQSDNTAYWKQQLMQRIDRDTDQLCLLRPQVDVNFQNMFPHEWCSTHERHHLGRSIQLHHILLDCCLIQKSDD